MRGPSSVLRLKFIKSYKIEVNRFGFRTIDIYISLEYRFKDTNVSA